MTDGGETEVLQIVLLGFLRGNGVGMGQRGQHDG